MAEETKIIRIVVDSSAAVDGSRSVTRALEQMQKAEGATTSAFTRLETSLNSMGSAVKGQLAIHLVELAGRLVGAAKAALEAAGGLGEMANQMGVTTKGLQALQFSAVQNGLKLEQLETGIAKFSQKMGEAAGGSKEMIEALNNIGVKILDSNGKLRSNEAALSDVAKAIASIEDPAVQTATAVDFFGKAGAKMVPLLKDMATGMDDLKTRAAKAGVVISDEAIAKLDVLSDRASVAGLRWRALFAEIGAPIAAAGLAAINNMLGSLLDKLKTLGEWAGNFARTQSTSDAQSTLAELNKRADEQRARVAALDADPNSLNVTKQSPYIFDRLRGKGATTVQADIVAERAKLKALETDRRNAEARLAQLQAEAEQRATTMLVSGTFGPLEAPDTGGASNPGVKGAGGAEADKYRQLEQQLQNTATAQRAMTAAALAGAQAFDQAKATVDAQNKVLGIFGQQLDENDPRLTRIRDLLLEIERGKVAESFAVATTELQKQNTVLEAEIRLRDQSVEVRSREIAMIKAQQEAEKGGAAITAEMVDARRASIEQNERLKAQGEELKKSNEVWTAPLKSALESIQRTGADMWEKLLETGKFSAEEFGQIFAKMARRAAAELLALSTIRPVIQFAVGGLSSLGLVSPATASSLGYGGGAGSVFSGGGTSGGMGGLGGFGGFGGFGGLSSSLGSFGTWLNTPFIGGAGSGYSSAVNAYGVANPEAMSAGYAGISGAAPGLTPLGAIGGGLSIGLGAYNLFTSKSTAGKIGGGLGMLGGAMGIAGMLMPALSALGPIGMGIGLLGSILPMLFGGGQPEVPPMPPLDYGAGVLSASGTGFTYSGNTLNGGKSMATGAESIGNSLKGLFAKAGLVGIAGSLIGGDIASGVNNTWNGQQWQGTPYTQIGLSTPTGYERVTYNDSSRTVEQAADLLLAEMFKANVLRGGVSGVSDSLRTATSTSNPTTGKAVQDLVEFVTIYDKLGKTSNATADALKAVDERFAQITESATRYGLDVGRVDQAKADEKTKIATDFASSIQRALNETMNPSVNALEDLLKETESLRSTNDALLKANIGAVDQTASINKLYLDKYRAITMEQAENTPQARLQKYVSSVDEDISLMGQAPIARTIKGWTREAGQVSLAAQAQYGFGSPEYAEATNAAMRQLSAKMRAASEDFIEGLHAMVRELDSPGAANAASLMKQRAADLATAVALDGPAFDGLWAVGNNVKEAMKAWNAKIFKVADDFRFSISQGLLEFTDPLQAQLNELNRARDEALKTAKANNDAVGQIYGEYTSRIDTLNDISVNNLWSVKEIKQHAEEVSRALTEVEQKRIESLTAEADKARQVADEVAAQVGSFGSHYVNINDVTELFLKKEKQLRETYYAQAIASFEELLKRITIGDLSGASSLSVLNGTKASYDAIRAQAFAGDAMAKERFSQSAGEYLSAGRDYYAYSPAYFAIRDQIKADIEALTSQIKGGTTGGTAVSADVQAVTQQLERALADNDNLKRTVEQLLAKQDRTNTLLERLAANIRV